MKIAIVGSREYNFVNRVMKRLLRLKEEYPEYLTIVTGGAKGVDKCAEDFANANKDRIGLIVVRPVNPADKFSYLLRNAEIIGMSDRIIAFWDGQSRGTKFVIDYATARGKEIEIIK